MISDYTIMRFAPETNKRRATWRVYKNGIFCQNFARKKDAEEWIKRYGQ